MYTEQYSIPTSALPSFFQKVLFPGEKVLAISKKHALWWSQPGIVVGCILTFGLYFYYREQVVNREILILTDKRIIGFVEMGLLTQARVDLFFNAVDNIQEDESFLGDIFGWVNLRIQASSNQYCLKQVEKTSAETFKRSFLEVELR